MAHPEAHSARSAVMAEYHNLQTLFILATGLRTGSWLRDNDAECAILDTNTKLMDRFLMRKE
jgi:hypothetical protein